MKQISLKKLDSEIKLQYGLDYFNSAFALFGATYQKNHIYTIEVTPENLKDLQDFQAQCFEQYVADYILIITYLLDIGIQGKVEIVE